MLVAGLTVWSITSSDHAGSTRSTTTRAGCRPAAVTPTSVPAAGSPAPAFVLPGLDGGCIRLTALRGRPVVVNFWASWCNPCRQEFPRLRAAYAHHHGSGLAVVGITYRDIQSDARRFARDHGAHWLLADDEDGNVARAYTVAAVPQTLFIGRDGVITARIYGPLSQHELQAELRRILTA